jgi:hypothetical protein
MQKRTRALSGASQDAYFRRVLKAHPEVSAEERSRLLSTLRQEVAQVRVRVDPAETVEAPAKTPARRRRAERRPSRAAASKARPGPDVPVAAPPFDPFCPNVIVVLRRSGRDAVLAALDAIESLHDLRLLAREQRLSVGANLSSAAELRAAIVAAAERRIANRLSASR